MSKQHTARAEAFVEAKPAIGLKAHFARLGHPVGDSSQWGLIVRPKTNPNERAAHHKGGPDVLRLTHAQLAYIEEHSPDLDTALRSAEEVYRTGNMPTGKTRAELELAAAIQKGVQDQILEMANSGKIRVVAPDERPVPKKGKAGPRVEEKVASAEVLPD